MHNPKLQQSFLDAAKSGDVELMKNLISQGVDPLAKTEDGIPIFSFLAQSDIDETEMREFVKFLMPYMYAGSRK